MSKRDILVIDGDPKNLQILKESLESSDFKVNAINDGIKAWESILTNRPDVIVAEVDLPGMNGFRLLEKLQKDPIASSIPLIFLTNRRGLEDRLKSLRSGVKDYMIKPLHVKEVVARINMILKRLERTNVNESFSVKTIVGRLEEKSVEELVENCGIERKTGVLTLYGTDNLNGEIYFREGAVVNARFGNFKAEKAVYQMLPWRQGRFVLTLKDIHIKDEITVSNLGLLLQGFKRHQERERFISQLPSLGSVFVRTSIFEQILKKKTISSDAFKFISLFDGLRTVSEIINESIYDDLKTLEKTTRLYEQGFIRPLDKRSGSTKSPIIPQKPRMVEKPAPVKCHPVPPTAKKEEALPPKLEPTINFQVETEFVPTNKIQKEISHKPVEKKVEKAIPPLTPPTLNTDAQVVRKPAPKLTQPNLIPQREQQPQFVKKPSSFGALCDKLLSRVQRQSGRLAIIGSDWQQRQALISTLTAGQYSQKNIGNTNRYPLEVGKIETEKKHVLEIVGFSTKSKYLQMLDEISETLVGYIVLVACDDPPALGYLGYLISTLKKKFGLPHIIAVYRPAGRKPVPLDVLRYTLKTDESDAFAEFDAQDVQSVMHVFEQLLLSNKPGLSP